MSNTPRTHFANNAAIHREIRTMLAGFDEPSRSRMRTKIGHDRAAARDHASEQADANARHTYFEFVVGLHLKQSGFNPEYGRRIGSKTPDWFDETARLVVEVFTCERGGTTAPGPRVAGRIGQKVRKYSATVREHGLSLVVAVNGDVLSGLTADGCERAIQDGRVFLDFPELSGVIFFAEDGTVPANRQRQVAFTYFANPAAARPLDLSGLSYR